MYSRCLSINYRLTCITSRVRWDSSTSIITISFIRVHHLWSSSLILLVHETCLILNIFDWVEWFHHIIVLLDASCVLFTGDWDFLLSFRDWFELDFGFAWFDIALLRLVFTNSTLSWLEDLICLCSIHLRWKVLLYCASIHWEHLLMRVWRTLELLLVSPFLSQKPYRVSWGVRWTSETSLHSHDSLATLFLRWFVLFVIVKYTTFLQSGLSSCILACIDWWNIHAFLGLVSTLFHILWWGWTWFECVKAGLHYVLRVNRSRLIHNRIHKITSLIDDRYLLNLIIVVYNVTSSITWSWSCYGRREPIGQPSHVS